MQIKNYKRVLTIAGSDSGGGAGVQADIKTISALGCYAASAITCITAQNTMAVQAIEPLSVEIIRAQIHSVLSDIGVDAIKIGMLASPEIAHAVAQSIGELNVPIVLDPVLVATSGNRLTLDSTIEVIVDELMPLATIITPNLDEAAQLTGGYTDSRAWSYLESRGAKALLIKGGHGTSELLSDTLYHGEMVSVFNNERIQTVNTHGTGCTLSSAIASYLALGFSLHDAVEMAITYTHKAIATGAQYHLGSGHGAVHHFFRIWQ